MNRRDIAFTTFNLLNLNEPDEPLYSNSTPWSPEEYKAKVAFSANLLQRLSADVYGFQELWHEDSLDSILTAAGLEQDFVALVPPDHRGDRIVCAAALRRELLTGDPEWITDFPPNLELRSGGDDPQSERISIRLSTFSRPVLRFMIEPRDDVPPIQVYVCHLKSKRPARIDDEHWYARSRHAKHAEAIGSALATVRRTAEAAALRVLVTEQLKDSDTPVVVLGDINDGILSNTLNIIGGQPNYLAGLSTGGSDVDLYAAETLQNYRSTRDVYYTHVFRNERESLDQILVSQEFYDNSRRRVWRFDGLDVANDHLDDEDHRQTGSADHGVVRARFRFSPAR